MSHPTAQDKIDILTAYREQHDLDVLVETGLYRGRGSGMSVPVGTYVAIDHQQANCDAARKAGFDARCGDSGDLLPNVLSELDAPALIWLDAHGVADDFPGFPDFPLFRELAAIAAAKHAHVVLIDDIEMMKNGTQPPLVGATTLDELRRVVDGYGIWDREEEDEIMRLTPKK